MGKRKNKVLKKTKKSTRKKVGSKQLQTSLQSSGMAGERFVVKNCACPGCKREKTLKQLINNLKCADIVCDFCGYLAQVKTKTVADVSMVPKKLLGAAWDPQRQRLEAGIYISLFIVLVDQKSKRRKSVYYLPAELQKPDMFVVRNPYAVLFAR